MSLDPTANSTAPSLLMVETGVSLIALALAFCAPRAGHSFFRRSEKLLGSLAARRRLSVFSVGAIALTIRLSLLPMLPPPQPFIHDEFSFLLAGDTFASGRVTNPTHPMWQHLESFHITWKPTYMSMYFPGQGLILAAGKRMAGDPWFGVCLSAAIMCAALCWMLQGWVPPGWALFGGLLAVLRLATFSYWVNGYYGGALAATGGCLILGALPRIMRRARARDGLLLASGVAIVANTRPWEGALVCAPVACALVWWLKTAPHPSWRILLRGAAPSLALLLAVGMLMGYYNDRVFGSPLTLPYQVNRATYASAPVFLWQTPRTEPPYRYAVMKEFYSHWELGDFLYAKSPGGFLSRTLQKAGVALFFFFGPALFAPLFMMPRVLRNRRIRFLFAAGLVFAGGLMVNAWLFPHYLAPFVGAIYIILLMAMRYLRAWRPGGVRYGLAIVRTIPVVCLVLAGVRVFASPLGITIHRWPTMWYGTEPLGIPRSLVEKELERRPGRQLAIVRYSAGHSVFDDWVYNAADVDGARVVWAREMGTKQDAELLRYFANRSVWLVEPDANPPAISPYPAFSAEERASR